MKRSAAVLLTKKKAPVPTVAPDWANWSHLSFFAQLAKCEDVSQDHLPLLLDELEKHPDLAKEKLNGDWKAFEAGRGKMFPAGEGVLHFCIRINSLSSFKRFWVLGADPLQTGKRRGKRLSNEPLTIGLSVLQLLCMGGALERLNLGDGLQFARVFVDCLKGKEDLLSTAFSQHDNTPWGGTPLMFATRFSLEIPLVHYLLGHGANSLKMDCYGTDTLSSFSLCSSL